ncbi:MAG: M23 family metallopeptidase [Prolixibacteraceae bacterium]|jgi:hypothetical protein|nr:M23 family metallopeptidase [Prolixibacteraceae bacterium]MBT6005204.1 M23 family metallopeptidase [Prolixibacteraceae bacterium]MBT6766349.1 M23 family metallopeptidase [Prolixibacteraceae bacterium]MBT6999820.1 M23 family metallopeptidase [Prolixibacteraceae bacterium]MBT7394715.1 M23 family metallopeptidase [Prolixibacteraceae bacterium]
MKFILLVLSLLNSVLVFGQNRYYTDPVKIPMLLSGSFAELRNNHFHSGIDIKTGGAIGVPVFAVANGFISRIAVSPTGFGKALYIQHPNGTTSVYAHLNKFSSEIEKYVKNIQYEKKTFRVDLPVPPKMFTVEQGDIIAKSGNSGSSGGPHLHFEIRETKTEKPRNPLKYNFTIVDKTAPKIFSVLLAPLSKTSHINCKIEKKRYPVVFYEGKYQLKNSPIIPVYGKIGFAVETNDYFDGSLNKCGIYSLQLKIDGELYFSFQMDQFSFGETKFINSHIDYEHFTKSKRRFQKAWIEPGNQLGIYKYIREKGIFEVNDGNIHHIEFVLTDTYGNTSELEFSIESKYKETKPPKENFIEIFEFDKINVFSTNSLDLEIHKGSMYNNINFQYKKLPAPDNYYSDFHVIHKNTVPLHKSADVRIKTNNLPKILESKALLINIDTISGNYFASGGEFNKGWVKSKLSTFGTYAVTVDTIPPKIIPLSLKNKNTLSETNRLRFKISDDLSGIKNIEGIIDDKWALFEYDPKNHLITHYFDNERFELKKRHQLLLTVSDYKGNKTTYEATFWK